ncbi:hypothetical protein LG198_13535 [Methylobacillus arboreus]|uniref:hypothetical protein n=1 Tax=Methylobacillus arboreus TaxID=755170 RepID=UPI001E47597F|nr:hypothetical protein [Methylobacillus arboreus]MCB5191756.1 hypothetical protein [Methylobacillus arboreus]
MRFSIIISAFFSLCLVLPVLAAEPDVKGNTTLGHEPVLNHYHKFDHGNATAQPDPHAGHGVSHDHGAHDMPQHEGHHEHMQHDHATHGHVNKE